MTNDAILEWELFRNKRNMLREFHIKGVHVFNYGKSAFLINEEEKLFAFGAENLCFDDNKAAHLPKKIRNLSNNGIQAIGTGEQHAVLLDDRGYVYCWGNNDFGQLGAGNTHPFTTPKEPRLPCIEQISCGRHFTIALDGDSEVWYWGRQYKDNGVLPIISMPIRVILSTPVLIDNISTGDNMATVLDMTGKVHVWGIKTCGYDGYRKNIIKPIRRDDLPRIKHLVNCRDRTAFITENGKFYLSGSATDASHFHLTEIQHCGRVVSLAASWCKDLFGVTNTEGAVFEIRYEEDVVLAARTEFTSVVEVFKECWTPSVVPLDDDTFPGVIQFSLLRADISENTNQTEVINTAEEAAEQLLPLAISGLNISGSDGSIDVSNLYNSQIFSDIEIKLSDGNISAHKIVLFSKSEYFKKLIEENWRDTKMVDMSNWTSGAYRSYIKYLYTGNLDVQLLEHLPEIYFLGSQDNNDQIKDACLKIWREKLTEENVLQLYITAHKCQQEAFLEECGSLLYEILPQLVTSNTFNNLPESVKLSIALTAAMKGRNCDKSS